jgi:lysozyme
MPRVYRYKPELLNGHPGNINRACKRLIVRATNAGLIVTSTTDGQHAPTSYHPRGMAVDFGTGDGGLGNKAQFQRWCARRPEYFLECFGPDNGANVKNGRVISISEGTPLEQAHDSHVHCAAVKPLPLIPIPGALRPKPQPDRKPAHRLSLSDKGLTMIANSEGYRARAYEDAAGHATIGFGHLLHHGGLTSADMAMEWDRARALNVLRNDAAEAQSAVRQLVKVPLTQNEFDALTSFVFNVGRGAFADSTLLRLLNEGKRGQAANQFLRWDKAGGKTLLGLSRRRRAERSLFLKKEN